MKSVRLVLTDRSHDSRNGMDLIPGLSSLFARSFFQQDEGKNTHSLSFSLSLSLILQPSKNTVVASATLTYENPATEQHAHRIHLPHHPNSQFTLFFSFTHFHHSLPLFSLSLFSHSLSLFSFSPPSNVFSLNPHAQN